MYRAFCSNWCGFTSRKSGMMRVLCGALCVLVLWFTVEPWINFACVKSDAATSTPIKCHESHRPEGHNDKYDRDNHKRTDDSHECCQVDALSNPSLHLPRIVSYQTTFIGLVPTTAVGVDAAGHDSSPAALPDHGPHITAHRTQAFLAIFLI